MTTDGADLWPIHSATDELAKSLLGLWRKKTPDEAYRLLARPDVRVTNKRDKLTVLAKIPREPDCMLMALLVAC